MMRVIPTRAIVPLAYMAGVFFLSSLPGSQIRRMGFTALMVNLAHVPLFAGLAWATFWAVLGPALSRVLWVVVVCGAFAVSDELHQTFVPGRDFSWGDLAADSVGICLGVAFGLWAWSSRGREAGKSTQ
jgi:hypothetical protein